MANRTTLRIFVTALFLCLFLAAATIDFDAVPSAWWDEGWLLLIARNWVEKGHYGRFVDGLPSPLNPTNGFPVIAPVALGFQLFGIGVWQGRILMAPFSLGAMILIYYLA